MTCTTIVRNMKGQKTGRYCVEVIVQGSPLLLHVVSDYTQQTLALKEHSYTPQCYVRHVCTMLQKKNGMDFQYDSVTVQIHYSQHRTTCIARLQYGKILLTPTAHSALFVRDAILLHVCYNHTILRMCNIAYNLQGSYINGTHKTLVIQLIIPA